MRPRLPPLSALLLPLVLPLLVGAALALAACADDDFGQPPPDMAVATATVDGGAAD